jgi:hypothetical protein
MYFTINNGTIDNAINDIFFISVVGNQYILFDEEISRLLGLTKDEYQKILTDFSGIIDNDSESDNQDIYFEYKSDAEEALAFLNEEYELILKLLD